MNVSPSLPNPQPTNAVVPPLAGVASRLGVLPPILWPCCGILVAGAIGSDYHNAWRVVALFGLGMAALAAVARSGEVMIAALTCLALAAGLYRAEPVANRAVVWTNESINAVRGIVATWPNPHGEMVQTRVAIVAVRSERGWQPATATLRATVPSYPPIHRGDVIVVGGVATLRRNWWPDADGSLYGQWARIERRDDTTTPTDLRHRAVARFITGIERYVRSPEANLATGMLLGEKSVLDTPTRDALNATGTTQHVVISGWNISIVIGLFAALGRNCTLRRRRAWSLAALATVALYTFAVGADLSVVRAAVMGGAALIAPLVGRRADPLVWLALACGIMALLDPTVVHDLSFLLSSTATFGVLVVAPWMAKVARRFSVDQHFPHLMELGAVAVAAYLMTEPIILHSFGRVSLISPLINIVVEPLVPVIMACGFVTALLSFLPFALPAAVAGVFTAVPAWLFLKIIVAAGALPISAVRLPQPGLDLTLLLYAFPACLAGGIGRLLPAIRGSSIRLREPDAALYAAGFFGMLVVAFGVVAWLG